MQEVKIPSQCDINTGNIEKPLESNFFSKKEVILYTVIAVLVGAGIACAIAIPICLKSDDDEETETVIVKEENNVALYPYGDSSKTTYIFGHATPDTDTITSTLIAADLEKKLGNQNKLVPCYHNGDFNKETKFILEYLNIDPPQKISNLDGADSVILVDHNAYTESIDLLTTDTDNLVIDKVYDHHMISGFNYKNTIDYTARQYGSTCTVLYKIYQDYNLEISKEVAGLTVSGIISDTTLLKSSITTDLDKRIIKEAAEKAGLNYTEYGEKVLRAYTDVSDLTDAQVVDYDTKTYDKNDICSKAFTYRVGTISSFDTEEFFNVRKDGIISNMNTQITENSYKFFLYFVGDFKNGYSYLIILGDKKDIVIDALKESLGMTGPDERGIYEVKQLLSRKKDVVPAIDAKIKEKCSEL